ncbi:hypothetical protein [Maricaulis salignorans]|uniref:hypothetical protein n=1 Tax=Maricaulis salignorans TaxID=144026 RepID=UPI003A8D9827
MKINSPGNGNLPAAFTNSSPISVFGRDFKRLKLQAGHKARLRPSKIQRVSGQAGRIGATNDGWMRPAPVRAAFVA